jgi:acyl-CoA reductase-like NAD-dependent aldehyde dehydrogenase
MTPAIVAGNTVVAIASERHPVAAVELAEVLATSDLPGGVVNIPRAGRRSSRRGSHRTWM